MSTRSHKAELVSVLMAHGKAPRLSRRLPRAVRVREATHVADEMVRLKRTAHHLAECHCNGELTDEQREMTQRTDERFGDLCASIGATAVLSGDPRGCVYHVWFPGTKAPHNTWGGAEKGWGIID